MLRVPAVLLPPLLVALLLTGCVPTAFDPRTGAGYEGVRAEFEAMSPEERLAAIASGDARIERSLWAGGELEEALGGPEAADEVFAGLFAQVAATRDAAEDDGDPYVLASFRDDLAEAKGAGAFAGMLVSNLLADAGITATRGGSTGDVSHDFGGSNGDAARATLSATEGGAVSTSFELSSTYKGVTIDITVGTEIDPCPDPTGVLEPKGTYLVNVTGPDGAGSSTRVDVQMEIQLNEDAQIANSDYTYEAAYSTRPQAPGRVFDFTTRSVRFSRDEDRQFHTDELSVAGFWDDAFLAEAGRVGEFFASWVSWSVSAAAQKGWEDGRCIDLRATYSAGPTGLEPDSEVTITASPVAKSDGLPAGGTVSAELTSGARSVTPSGTKVPADASFSYVAPSERDKSGTVRLESRSRRGVGILEVTLDTSTVIAYSAVGGGGAFQGQGTICDLAKPFTISGSGVTVKFVPASARSGTYSYTGAMEGANVFGGESYEVTYAGDVAESIKGWGIGTIEVEGYTASGYAEEHYVLTKLDDVPAGCR